VRQEASSAQTARHTNSARSFAVWNIQQKVAHSKKPAKNRNLLRIFRKEEVQFPQFSKIHTDLDLVKFFLTFLIYIIKDPYLLNSPLHQRPSPTILGEIRSVSNKI